MLLTTQYLDEADRLADRIAVIDQGLVIAEGTPDELKTQVGGERLEIHLCDGDAARKRSRRWRRSRSDGPTCENGTVPRPASPSAAGRSPTPSGASTRPGSRSTTSPCSTPTLDDVFLTLTGHAAEEEAEETEVAAR